MLSLARSELGKTCLWVRYSKTTRNRIDLLISLLSTTVRYLLSVWLDTTQTEAVHRKMTVLASTGRVLKKYSVMLFVIGCYAIKSSACTMGLDSYLAQCGTTRLISKTNGRDV